MKKDLFFPWDQAADEFVFRRRNDPNSPYVTRKPRKEYYTAGNYLKWPTSIKRAWMKSFKAAMADFIDEHPNGREARKEVKDKHRAAFPYPAKDTLDLVRWEDIADEDRSKADMEKSLNAHTKRKQRDDNRRNYAEADHHKNVKELAAHARQKEVVEDRTNYAEADHHENVKELEAHVRKKASVEDTRNYAEADHHENVKELAAHARQKEAVEDSKNYAEAGRHETAKLAAQDNKEAGSLKSLRAKEQERFFNIGGDGMEESPDVTPRDDPANLAWQGAGPDMAQRSGDVSNPFPESVVQWTGATTELDINAERARRALQKQRSTADRSPHGTKDLKQHRLDKGVLQKEIRHARAMAAARAATLSPIPEEPAVGDTPGQIRGGAADGDIPAFPAATATLAAAPPPVQGGAGGGAGGGRSLPPDPASRFLSDDAIKTAVSGLGAVHDGIFGGARKGTASGGRIRDPGTPGNVVIPPHIAGLSKPPPSAPPLSKRTKRPESNASPTFNTPIHVNAGAVIAAPVLLEGGAGGAGNRRGWGDSLSSFAKGLGQTFSFTRDKQQQAAASTYNDAEIEQLRKATAGLPQSGIAEGGLVTIPERAGGGAGGGAKKSKKSKKSRTAGLASDRSMGPPADRDMNDETKHGEPGDHKDDRGGEKVETPWAKYMADLEPPDSTKPWTLPPADSIATHRASTISTNKGGGGAVRGVDEKTGRPETDADMNERAKTAWKKYGDVIISDTNKTVDQSTVSLRPQYGQLGPDRIIPSGPDQVRSDVGFDMFSVVKPGFGKGSDNSLYLHNEAHREFIQWQDPMFQPGGNPGPIGGIRSMDPRQNTLKSMSYVNSLVDLNKQRRTLATNTYADYASTGATAGSLPVDIGYPYATSSTTHKRDGPSPLRPVIDTRDSFLPVFESAGVVSSKRRLRHQYDPWRFPQEQTVTSVNGFSTLPADVARMQKRV